MDATTRTTTGASEAHKRANRKYYNNRYANDVNFREAEIQRMSVLVTNKYKNDPVVRERMKANALARYYRLKAEKQAKS
jgi:hypothetical protein